MLGGALLGTAAGIVIGRIMTEEYTLFFRFPVLAFRLEFWVPLLATAVSLVAGVAGALSAVRSVIRLVPAEAMRPPAPAAYREGLLDRAGWIVQIPARRRMMLRGITGRPWRAMLTSLGIALAVAIVMISAFWRDAIDYMIAVQFAAAERADATVVFTGPVRGRALHEIDTCPASSQPSRSARFRFGCVLVTVPIGPRSPGCHPRGGCVSCSIPSSALFLCRRMVSCFHAASVSAYTSVLAIA